MIDRIRLRRIRRSSAGPTVTDPAAATRDALARVDLFAAVPAGSRVAIAISSRRIAAYDRVIATIVEHARDRGLSPTLIAAMGSHGGATAAGQQALLASHGIDAESLGVAIDTGQDVSWIGDAGPELPVHAPSGLERAGAVVLVNRIRPHTAFGGQLGSGLAKMLAIGLGRAEGARAVHAAGQRLGLGTAIRAVAVRALELLPVTGGVGLIENATGRLAEVAAVSAAQLLDEEPQLLRRAAALRPKLGFDEIDVLVLDRIGKDIAGTGLDPWVVGRLLSVGEPEPATPRVRRIYARSLSEASHGNAHGVGLTDLVHRRLAEAIDWDVTRLNAITAGAPQKARLPLVMRSDREAVAAALATAGVSSADRARLVWARDTGQLEEVMVSRALWAEALDAGAEVVGDVSPLSFDGAGDLRDL